MPKHHIAALAFLVVALTTYTARADWEFSRWTMSLDQVIAAGHGRVVRLNPQDARGETSFTDEGRCLAQIRDGYALAGVRFDKANFCFDEASGRLAAVDLYVAGIDRFGALDRALRSAFGQPVQQTGDALPLRLFNDPAKHNTLALHLVGDTVILQYRPSAQGF